MTDEKNYTTSESRWDHRFLRLAREIAVWSKDPSKQVSAIAVDDNRRILSTGYNGFPSRIKDDDRLYDREEKYKYIVHGEMNCIYNAVNNGVSLKDATLYVYGLPVCSTCATAVISVGIKRVVYFADDIQPRWERSAADSYNMFMEAGIPVRKIHSL